MVAIRLVSLQERFGQASHKYGADKRRRILLNPNLRFLAPRL